MAFVIKKNDTRPYLQAQFFQPDGVTPLVLSAATNVYIIVSVNPSGAPVFRKACLITSAASGIVEYRWVAGDTATSGSYKYEFEINWNDGTKQTIPADTYFDLSIVDDLD